MIGVFIGKKLGEGIMLQGNRQMADVINNNDNRPEDRLFQSQVVVVDAQRKKLDTKLLPGWVHLAA